MFEHQTGGSSADLLLVRFPQHALPHGPNDGDVLAPCGVAVGLERGRQSQAANHGLQDLSHVAEGQTSLRPGAGVDQLHGAGDQTNLAGAENCVFNLSGKEYKEKKMQNLLNNV